MRKNFGSGVKQHILFIVIAMESESGARKMVLKEQTNLLLIPASRF
jgi:hypothetical protein